MAFLLSQLLTESAQRLPHQAAVVSPEATLTYAELDRLSNQIANQLIDDGVGGGDRIALFLPKSTHSVAALFGILKAGAAYVPVDPNSPPQRAAYILRNCDIRGLVTSSEKVNALPEDFFDGGTVRSVLLVDNLGKEAICQQAKQAHVSSFAEVVANCPVANPCVPVIDNDLAYILYTSGSTGEPKGVAISHLNSLTFVNWCFDEFAVKPSDKVSSHAPFHFDLSIFDIFCTIKAGATIYLVPQEIHAFPVRLAGWIAEQEITIWYSVPSALIQLVERGRLEAHSYDRLRKVLFAGEVFPIKYLRQLALAIAHPDYYNLYGPTETNVCTYYRVQASDLAPERTEPVPIGKACANTTVVAVDDQGQPVGAHGEGETGDIVRPLPSGDYQYVGRHDKMIKSRGYRIELGEIEAALYTHPGVNEAAAVAVADERIGARIVAYIVSNNGLEARELENHCKDRLPRYMMPERFEFRLRLPKTSTGKIDKVSLEKEEVK